MEDDNYCDECGEDVGFGSHYHCAYCNGVCGMQGHQECYEKANGPIKPLKLCGECGHDETVHGDDDNGGPVTDATVFSYCGAGNCNCGMRTRM